MLDGNNDTNPPRTLEERYETACGASSLRVQAEKGGPGDVLIASGSVMHVEDKSREANAARVGMSLLRLHSQYAGAEKPAHLTTAQVRALAEAFKAADEAERTNRDRENGELERLRGLLAKMESDDQESDDDESDDKGRAELMEKIAELEDLYERGYLPLPAVKTSGNHMARARAHADKWYAGELRRLALTLTARPAVWAQLQPWAQAKGIPEDHVAQALFHWLDPVCGHCDGHGLHKAKDAPALSAKQCRACNGTGTKAIPEGGGRVLSYLSHCTSQARASISKRLRQTR